MSVVGIPRESLPEQTYGQSFVNMFPGWGGAYATPEQKEKASATVASLIDFLIPTATRDMPTEDIRNLYTGQTMGLGFPMATTFGGKKLIDFTQVQAWKKPFKSGTTYKAYHGKPGGKPITDVYTGMHVGSPGAAIDRLAETSSLLSRVPAGYVTALELSPKNPLLKTSPHFKHIYKKWNRGPYKTPSYSSRPTGEIDKSTQLLDEYLGADYSFLQAFQKSNIDLMKMIRRLGYDTIPYINKWENPGSVSTIILNPKRASPNILDEAYRFEMPFYKSTEPTMNLSKKQLKEWISQQKAGKGDLYDIFMQNAPGQKLVRFNKYGIPIVTSPLGPVQANKDYINQILTIKDLMQATK